MKNELIILLPNLILLALFVFFIWRRHSLRSYGWLTMVCITLGVALLAVIIVLVLNNQPVEGSALRRGLLAIPVVIFVLFLLFLTRVLTVEKVKSRFHLDERITTMNAKSARNALAAVYLTTVIDLVISTEIDLLLLLVIMGVSLLVYLASMVIYYFRSFE